MVQTTCDALAFDASCDCSIAVRSSFTPVCIHGHARSRFQPVVDAATWQILASAPYRHAPLPVLIGRHQQNGAGVLARKIRCFYELFFGDLSKAREANAFKAPDFYARRSRIAGEPSQTLRGPNPAEAAQSV